MLLWIGQSVSQVGNQFTGLALPLIAVLTLDATAGEMGLLGAMGTFPFLLFGLLIGVWVDRHPRRPILLFADLGRGAIVAAVAVLALVHVLAIPQLYLLGFLTGVLTVFFDVSYQAYLPSLVDRAQLVEGNSKLEASNATASVGGPVLAGLVIQFLSAPFAMVFDALTFFVSSGTLWRIRKIEPPKEVLVHGSVLHDVREGLGVIFRDRRLWSIAGCTGTSNFASGAIFVALLVFYAVRELGMTAATLGLATGIGALGGIAGALSAASLAKRFGVGPTIVASIFVGGLGPVALVFATPALAIPVIALVTAVTFGTSVVYNINQVSLRQALVPLRLQGRLNASMRFLVWGTLPIGSLFGGFLASLLPVRTAIALMAAVGLVAFLWVLFSPVRQLMNVPEPTA
jgi:MFS family permease